MMPIKTISQLEITLFTEIHVLMKFNAQTTKSWLGEGKESEGMGGGGQRDGGREKGGSEGLR